MDACVSKDNISESVRFGSASVFFWGGGTTKKKNPLRLAWLDTTVANFRAVPFKTQLTSIVPGGAKVAVVC